MAERKQDVSYFKKKNGSHKKTDKFFEFKFNLNVKTIFIGLFVLFLVLSAIGSVGGPNALYPEKPLSSVVTDIKDGKIEKIEVEESKLTVTYKDGEHAISHKEPQESL